MTSNKQLLAEELHNTFVVDGTRDLGWVNVDGEWINGDDDLIILTTKVLDLTKEIKELPEQLTVEYLLNTDKLLFALVSSLLTVNHWERGTSGLSNADILRAKEIDDTTKHFMWIPEMWVSMWIRQLRDDRMREEYEARQQQLYGRG